jgi:hypothetical protein
VQEDEIELRVRADIERSGWHVVILPPEGGTPGWMHTIGLQERFDHPELIVFGSDLERLGPLVNHLGERVRAGERYAEAADVEGILTDQPLAFRPVVGKWTSAFLGNAAWHYRSETVPTIQCFWPDPGGRFPWEPEADPTWRDDQPLLFEEQTHRALSERMIDVLRREGAL